MRKILLAGVALLALGSVAQADPSFQPGNPHQPPVSPPPPPAPDVDNSPPMVVDAAGQVVGFSVDDVIYVNVAASGAPSFLVRTSSRGTPLGFSVSSGSTRFPVSAAQTSELFLTHDCSGPAYLPADSLPPAGFTTDAVHPTGTSTFDPERWSGTMTLAYPQPPYQVIGYWSTWQQTNAPPIGVVCHDIGADQASPNEAYAGVVATHTLSFTAPFHVE